MNCKPGDLAVVVSPGRGGEDEWVGRMIVVTKTSRGPSGLPCWEYEGPRLISRVWGPADGIADKCLRPIRDPGDDAIDEVIQKLGSPAWSDAYGVKV